MTKEEVHNLVEEGKFLEDTGKTELIETHISWVILCDKFVYKIKKPVHYSFLDFSTLEKRQHFCKREIELNQRLTDNIYLDVQPVYKSDRRFIIGGNEGKLIEHAVRMNKQDRNKQMDRLLSENKVTNTDIRNLAEKIALFHQQAVVIYKKDISDIQEKFNDLCPEKEFLTTNIGAGIGTIIDDAIRTSDEFISRNRELLVQRTSAGFVRDGHGDLHSRNIFLLPDPQPFDCIEFNDDFRQIDVLNEVAFLCMDLDAFEREDLSDLFMNYYNHFFPTMATSEEYRLFIYYKSYRANVRAKVNSLRAKSTTDNADKKNFFQQSEKYLRLMGNYLREVL